MPLNNVDFGKKLKYLQKRFPGSQLNLFDEPWNSSNNLISRQNYNKDPEKTL